MYNNTRAEDIWIILCLVGGVVAAIAGTGPVSRQLNWSWIIVGPLIFVTTTLIIHLPITIRFLMWDAALRNEPLGLGRSSAMTLHHRVLYAIAFVVTPIVIGLWLLQLVLQVDLVSLIR